MAALGLTLPACGGDKGTEGAKPAPAKPLAACPGTHKEVKQDRFECACSAVTGNVSVWGDGIYTSDSSLCHAAAHAGAIDPKKGGNVTVVKAAGCAGYSGSEKNGVKTNGWGSFEQSFYFDGHGDGKCKAPAKKPAAVSVKDLKVAAKELKAVKDQAKAKLKAIDPALGKAADDLDKSAAEAVAGMKDAGKALKADVEKKLGGAAAALKNSLSGAPAKPLASDGDCPSSFSKAGKDEVTCTCGKAGGRNGTVYGAHPFTADSSICASARALGLVGADGGKVTAKAAPGCSKYNALVANGITTNAWAAYGKSFVFPAKGAAACPTVSANDACPSSFQGAGKDEVTCMCSPDKVSGSLYGSGPYTTDSSICRAAKHAGILTNAAVKVTAKKAPGCSKYLSSAANGVTASAWGAYGTSFVFANKPAACPAP